VIDGEDEGIVPNDALGDEWLSDEEWQLRQLQRNQNIPAGVPFIAPEEQQAKDDDALPPLQDDGDSDDGDDDNNQGGQCWQPAHARRQRVPNC
jgi:hypothetical protein